MAVMVISNIGKWLYRVYMYKPLFVNVSVSLIVSGVQPHMTPTPVRVHPLQVDMKFMTHPTMTWDFMTHPTMT